MENISYLRVSSANQKFDRQFDGMPKKIDKQFLEKASAAQNAKREVLEQLIDYVGKGDHIWVHSLDRLARSMADLISILEDIHKKGAIITFVKEGLTLKAGDDCSSIDKLLLGVLNSVAEFERNIIRERQAEGIRKARERGVYVGRVKKHSESQREAIVLEANQADLFGPKMKKKDVCKKYGIAKSTLQRYEKEVREKMKSKA